MDFEINEYQYRLYHKIRYLNIITVHEYSPEELI